MDAKRRRTTINPVQKKEIVEYAQNHAKISQQEIADHFSALWDSSVKRRTVGDILAERDKWNVDNVELCKYGRGAQHSDLEDALVLWLNNTRGENGHISDEILRNKAKSLGDEMDITDFTYSNGWLHRFKSRHSIGKRISSTETGLDKEVLSDGRETADMASPGCDGRETADMASTGLLDENTTEMLQLPIKGEPPDPFFSKPTAGHTSVSSLGGGQNGLWNPPPLCLNNNTNTTKHYGSSLAQNPTNQNGVPRPPTENRTQPPSSTEALVKNKVDEDKVDNASAKGLFGWTTIDKVNIPYLLRHEKKFVAVRMVELKLLSRYPNFYPGELKEKPPVISHFVTHAEAKLLNEINLDHCAGEFGFTSFTTKDLLVSLPNFEEFYNVVKKHYPSTDRTPPSDSKQGNIAQKTDPLDGGWLQINNTVIPYVSRGSVKYLPLSVVRYAAGLLTDSQVDGEDPREEECKFLSHICTAAGLDFKFAKSTKLVPLGVLYSKGNGKLSVTELPKLNPFSHAQYPSNQTESQGMLGNGSALGIPYPPGSLSGSHISPCNMPPNVSLPATSMNTPFSYWMNQHLGIFPGMLGGAPLPDISGGLIKPLPPPYMQPYLPMPTPYISSVPTSWGANPFMQAYSSTYPSVVDPGLQLPNRMLPPSHLIQPENLPPGLGLSNTAMSVPGILGGATTPSDATLNSVSCSAALQAVANANTKVGCQATPPMTVEGEPRRPLSGQGSTGGVTHPTSLANTPTDPVPIQLMRNASCSSASNTPSSNTSPTDVATMRAKPTNHHQLHNPPNTKQDLSKSETPSLGTPTSLSSQVIKHSSRLATSPQSPTRTISDSTTGHCGTPSTLATTQRPVNSRRVVHQMKTIEFRGKNVPCLVSSTRTSFALVEVLGKIFFPGYPVQEFQHALNQVLQVPIRTLEPEEEIALANKDGLSPGALKNSKIVDMRCFDKFYPHLKYMFKDKCKENNDTVEGEMTNRHRYPTIANQLTDTLGMVGSLSHDALSCCDKESVVSEPERLECAGEISGQKRKSCEATESGSSRSAKQPFRLLEKTLHRLVENQQKQLTQTPDSSHVNSITATSPPLLTGNISKHTSYNSDNFVVTDSASEEFIVNLTDDAESDSGGQNRASSRPRILGRITKRASTSSNSAAILTYTTSSLRSTPAAKTHNAGGEVICLD